MNKYKEIIQMIWLMCGMLFVTIACGTANTVHPAPDDKTNPDDKGKVFYAGASRISITPPPSQIVGSRTEIQNEHDSLYVRSLLLDDGDTKLLFVVVDVVGISDYLVDIAKQKAHQRTGIPVKNIMISATHTHHGLSVGRKGRATYYEGSVWTGWELDPYQSLVCEQIAVGAEVALANLEPVHIGWGKADVPQWVHNRRFKMKTKEYKTPWGEVEDVLTLPSNRHSGIVEPLGPFDPEVSFISVKTPDGRPVALFASYSPHYPTDIPAPYISADYYGVFSQQIQALLKANHTAKPFVGSITIGTAGDQASIDRRVARPSGTVLEIREQMGFDVARGVYQVYKNVQHKPWVKLDVEQSSLQLDVRVKSVTPEEMDYAEFLLDRQRQGLSFLNHRLETNYAKHLIWDSQVWPDKIDMTLQAFRIGNLAVVAVPGEVFSETGLSIKEKSPFAGTYTNGMSNGTFGYLATESQHEWGGYETWIGLSSRVEKAAATKIEAEVLHLLFQLKERQEDD